MEYCAFWLISASCKRVLKRSNMALAPAGVSYDSIWPASIMKSQAIYTEDSVGWLRRMKSNWRPAYSPRTLWFIRCAIIFVVAMHTILLFRSYALLNCIITLFSIRFPISGSLVFITEIKAAYTWVKFGDAIWALMIDLESRPLPLRMFSLNSSMTMFWMFEMLTLLTIPFILFLSNSHIIFWC